VTTAGTAVAGYKWLEVAPGHPFAREDDPIRESQNPV
jgi:hypothetical protein